MLRLPTFLLHNDAYVDTSVGNALLTVGFTKVFVCFYIMGLSTTGLLAYDF